MIRFRPGVRPNDPDQPRLKLKPFLTGNLPVVPASVDWDKAVPEWPMYANDQYGDCVFAMLGHAVQAWTANAGTMVEVTTKDVLNGYTAVTGFNPANPNSDRGTNVQDALNYWRKAGLAGHKIVAFAEVDNTEAELKAAAALFGVVLLAIDCPRSAMSQFDAGEPWDVIPDDQGTLGGHAIMGARYDTAKNLWYLITWGKEQETSFQFLRRYLREAWVAISPEWVEATGKTPSGLDLVGLGVAFATLTGDPNPFPGPPREESLAGIVDEMRSDASVTVWVSHTHIGHAAVLQKYLRELLAAPRA